MEDQEFKLFEQVQGTLHDIYEIMPTDPNLPQISNILCGIFIDFVHSRAQILNDLLLDNTAFVNQAAQNIVGIKHKQIVNRLNNLEQQFANNIKITNQLNDLKEHTAFQHLQQALNFNHELYTLYNSPDISKHNIVLPAFANDTAYPAIKSTIEQMQQILKAPAKLQNNSKILSQLVVLLIRKQHEIQQTRFKNTKFTQAIAQGAVPPDSESPDTTT